MQDPIGSCTSTCSPAENEFQLFPTGQFRTQDGRPKGLSGWVMNAATAARLIEAFNTKKNPMLVDYEHQTTLTKDNGKPAPAAGWVHGLEWREGKGLFAVGVKWTDAARLSIQSDEYRYISPVFHYNPQSGEVTSLLNAALTNSPALDGMESAVALRAQLQAQADELTSLRLERAKLEIEDVVQAAYQTGRLLPYQVAAARELGASNMEALKVILDRPSMIPGVQSEAIQRAANGRSALSLNVAELRMCELSGRSPEEFAALKARFNPHD